MKIQKESEEEMKDHFGQMMFDIHEVQLDI